MNENLNEAAVDDAPKRTLAAMWRGWRQRCPVCGERPLYRKYLKQVERCDHCGTALGEIRADDFPPYLTIIVVGHIIVPAIVLTERHFRPETWVHMVIWLPLTLLMMMWFLPRLKGVAIGMMLGLGLRGDERQGPEMGPDADSGNG